MQVGVAADLKNNYLARLSDVFHLHHVKVVCESSEDNVAAESISDPLWLRGGKARIKLTTPAPPCAKELRQALADAIQEQGLHFSRRDLLHKQLSHARNRASLLSNCEKPARETLVELDRLLAPLLE